MANSQYEIFQNHNNSVRNDLFKVAYTIIPSSYFVETNGFQKKKEKKKRKKNAYNYCNQLSQL